MCSREETMREIIRKLEKISIKQENVKLINLGVCINYNDYRLWDVLKSYIGSHIVEENVEKDPEIHFNMICNDQVYNELICATENGDRGETKVLSYCSKEKGTLRLIKFSCGILNIYKTSKTNAILIEEKESVGKFWYIVNNKDFEEKQFKKDGFKFFEHIINKYSNVSGSILMHSAAVAYNNKIVSIIGPKRSGKTTVFMDMIKHIGCNPVSFDKAHILQSNEGIILYGMPTRLRILSGTLKKYTGILDYLIPKQYLSASEDRLWEGESESKVDVSFEDFRKFTKKEFIIKGKLELIVIPNIGREQKEEVSLVTKEEFLQLVEMQFFTPYNLEEDWWSEIGATKKDIQVMKENREKMIEFIWNNIPIVKISGATNLAASIEKIKRQYLESS